MLNITNLDSLFQARKEVNAADYLNETDVINFTDQEQEQNERKTVDFKRSAPVEKNVPITEKILLTLEEAALLTGIGQNKLREISNEDNCSFVLWNGNKRMFKREKLITFLNAAFSI